MFEETFAGSDLILERGINTSGSQVRINVVLPLIRDDFNAFWCPVFITERLLGGALQYAYPFAFQRLDCRLNVRIFRHHQTRIGSVQFVGEGNFLLTFFRNGKR
ncbi:Uncharacterised protein [Shigella flexneri]|nr:Uncharacterised protein [Shigella flexneri]